jgi:DNA topoisomerase-3
MRRPRSTDRGRRIAGAEVPAPAARRSRATPAGRRPPSTAFPGPRNATRGGVKGAAAPSEQGRDSRPPSQELGCPRCGTGTLIAGSRGWGCARWREGCRFVVWFETCGRRLTPAQLRDLVVRGKTRKARFRSERGVEIDGRLVLDPAAHGGARLEPA